MRWDNLKASDGDGASRLPGVETETVTRSFDAPEAMGIRFHEIQARSALNSVPPMSHVDFRWTINPYRGCSHACVYCLAADTPILMADGTLRPIGTLSQGEEIYGTVRRGRYRRYVRTQVEAIWETRKRANRIRLADGTALIASSDHRFLTDRGWKFVRGSEQGARRRPHLTLNNRMLGFGAIPGPPDHTEEFRHGYLCGMIRGDGTLGTYEYPRPSGTTMTVHRFRLALADIEGIDRSQQFLQDMGIATQRFPFSPGTAETRAITAIRTSTRAGVQACRELTRWPNSLRLACDDWIKGFLSGIFDAEGSHSHGVMRIANGDPSVVGWIEGGLKRLGIRAVTERIDRLAKPMYTVRVVGGVPARMRFLGMVDPAIERKRAIEGLAVKGKHPLEVTEIEELPGRMRMFDIQTGTGDFIANGVISHNCFARPTHTYLGFNAREDFEREIVVKVNLPEVLRAELKRPSWKGEHVALGTNTDPYQWVEGRYRITRGLWEELLAARNPCSILTKSPLLLRDIDLFKQLDERASFAANLSIPTLDEKAWRATEPATPHPRKRIEAVAELRAAGIETGVLIAPLMPGINDSPAQVNEILELCGEAGATSIGGVALHLRGDVREIFLDWLRQYRADLLPRYERLYERRSRLEAGERRRLGRLVRGGSSATRSRRLGSSGPQPQPDGPAPAEPDPGIPQRLF